MAAATLTTHAGCRRRCPSTSTTQIRHRPLLVVASWKQIVGTLIPRPRAASRTVVPCSTSRSCPSIVSGMFSGISTPSTYFFEDRPGFRFTLDLRPATVPVRGRGLEPGPPCAFDVAPLVDFRPVVLDTRAPTVSDFRAADLAGFILEVSATANRSGHNLIAD